MLCGDALPAALLGGLLETVGWHPVFAEPDEPPREAVRRLRPTLVLADCGYEPAWSGAFLGPARMLGVPVIVIGTARAEDAVRRLAAEHELRSLLVPTDAATLERCLAEALEAR